MKLSSRQIAIIVGSVLGDGYMGITPAGTSYLEVKQQKGRKEYIFWLYEELKDLCASKPRQRRDNGQWRLLTRNSHLLSRRFRETFYRSGKKSVPTEIGKLLTDPVSLAVWYMDDGRLDYRPKSHYAYYLATDGFTKQDVKRLIEVLKNNFGIEASMHYLLSREARYPKIYIGKAGRDRFRELVSPYLLSCFADKAVPLSL